MKCDGCEHASWKRTVSGKLHPDKSGRCTALFSIEVPAAFYWLSKPAPGGGYLERGRDLGKECTFRIEVDQNEKIFNKIA